MQIGHAGLDRLAQAGADVSRRRNDSTPPTTMPRHQTKQRVPVRPVEPLDESGRLRMPSRREHWTALESSQQLLGQLTAKIGAVVADALGGDPTLVNNSINAQQTAPPANVTNTNRNTCSAFRPLSALASRLHLT